MMLFSSLVYTESRWYHCHHLVFVYTIKTHQQACPPKAATLEPWNFQTATTTTTETNQKKPDILMWGVCVSSNEKKDMLIVVYQTPQNTKGTSRNLVHAWKSPQNTKRTSRKPGSWIKKWNATKHTREKNKENRQQVQTAAAWACCAILPYCLAQ
jgi:hypothetical protein